MSLIKRIVRRIIRRVDNSPPGTVIYGDTGLLTCGDRVSFGGNVILQLNAPVYIGDGTMVGCGTIVHTATHDYRKHPMWSVRRDRPVSIGSFVWIGMGALILPGVRIGDHAVVGAGAVVTKNVPEGAIVAGNPARIIGYREPDVYGVGCDLTHDKIEIHIIKEEHLTDTLC